MLHTNRITAVVEKMKERRISQLLICDVLSIYYLTGTYVNPGERFYALYLHVRGNHLMFLNKLFTVSEEPGLKIVWYSDAQPVMDIVAEYMDTSSELGVDKNLPARFLLPLQEKSSASGFKLASICVDECRKFKDTEEQTYMREVSQINDLAIMQFKKLFVPGVTEKHITEQMLRIYRALGADDYSFEPIIAFGASAAEAHHEVGDSVLKEGDCILMDVGCRKNMYCSDMTRTFFYKYVSDDHRKIYDIVKKANEAAIAAIKPGLPLKRIDETARNIITDAGFGPNFTHRLGHFIGLDVHEFGDVSSVSEDIAMPGMVFSIEPGIYLPGVMGIRIEDLVCVTEESCALLNQYSKELEIID